MKRNKQQYTFIDLFAGLGGFHIALQELGCKCVFASELKDDLRKLYEENYPGTHIEGDITKIDISIIPSHDILCAGFPCQPFSQAGKQQGFNDEKQRGNLFDYICAIIQYHRPKYIFWRMFRILKGMTMAILGQKLIEDWMILIMRFPSPRFCLLINLAYRNTGSVYISLQ